MTLVKELEFENNWCWYKCFSTFTYRRLSNNSISYYVNEKNGSSIYDQDWNLIKRINSTGSAGQMFIVDDFIYIGDLDPVLKKYDLNFELINLVPFPRTWWSSFTYDSCNKRILVLSYCLICVKISIRIDIYNLNLRKIAEMNTISINDYFSNYKAYFSLTYYNNQLFIVNQMNSFPYELNMLVTDSNGQLIETYQLQDSSVMKIVACPSIVNDRFGNILYAYRNQLCLFNLIKNKTSSCMNLNMIKTMIHYAEENKDYDLTTYLNLDQSGRLVLLNTLSKKILFYF